MASVAAPAPDTHPVAPAKARAAAPREACLVLIYPSGPNMGRRYPLADGPVDLGRCDTCDVTTADPAASRRHARVEPRADGHLVADLQSTNGTFVNDRPVTGPTALRDGDYLRVGECIYRYLAGGNVEAEYHEELYRLTIQDGLTRTGNRRALTDFLEREAVRSRRHARPLSVVLFDIDHFKAVNDAHGHLAGDAVLRELVDRVRPVVRREDLFARYGGEEFALALVETPHEAAVAAGERVRAAVAAGPVRVADAAVRVTVSVGVATTAGEPGLTATELLQLADDRLYQAKRAGRDRVAGA